MTTIEQKLDAIKQINIKKDVIESNLNTILTAKDNSIDRIMLDSSLFNLEDLKKTTFEIPEPEMKQIVHIIHTYLTTRREQLIVEAEKIINEQH